MRPCKWSSCEYHYVNPSGTVYCILDEADLGERSSEEIAEILGVSMERVRQIAFKAERKIKRHLQVLYVE